MKIWFREIGDLVPSIVTVDTVNRPGEIFTRIEGTPRDHRSFIISWDGDTPLVSENTDWPEEESSITKLLKLESDLLVVDTSVKEADKQPFHYLTHTYYPDTEFIQGMFSMLPYLPADYTETWKTAEKEADGITNIYVTLDKAGIAGLAQAYLQFKKDNWLAGETQKAILKNEFLGD